MMATSVTEAKRALRRQMRPILAALTAEQVQTESASYYCTWHRGLNSFQRALDGLSYTKIHFQSFLYLSPFPVVSISKSIFNVHFSCIRIGALVLGALKGLPAYQTACTVSVYLSMANSAEIQTLEIVHDLIASGA
jgi:hypothetical protein